MLLTIFLVTCCDKVMVEDLSGRPSSNGLYTKMTDGTTAGGVPVYKNSDGSKYLFLSSTWLNVWVIGPDPTSSTIGVKSAVIHQILFFNRLLDVFLKNGDFCPEDGVGWQY